MNKKEYIDIYEALELKPGASVEEVKKAYKVLIRKYHPDRFQKVADKKKAEEKFKLIREAYDYLMSNDEDDDEFSNVDENGSFKKFFDSDGEEEEDYLSDNLKSPDFLKFFFEQQKTEPKKSTKKNKTETRAKTSRSQKTRYTAPKKEKTTSLKTDSIKYFEKYISDKKISLIHVFKCIRDNVPIIEFDEENNTSTTEDLLLKEVLYRRHIRESKEYENFQKHYSFFKNIDIHATLNIFSNYTKTKFEENVNYISKSICPECYGAGCDKCDDGIQSVEKITRIKIDSLVDGASIYEIDNGGNKSSLGTGKLIITVNYHKNPDGYANIADSQPTYEFKLKSNMALSFEPIKEAYEWTASKVEELWSYLISNPHIFTLYSVIFILIIVIILLSILL